MVHVHDDDRARAAICGVSLLRLESSIAVAEHDAHGAVGFIGDHQIREAVAVDVGSDDRLRMRACLSTSTGSPKVMAWGEY